MGWVILIVAAALYAASWYIHPLQNCRSCKGTPRLWGGLHKSKFRFCHACQGTGRAVRPGAKVLMGMGLMKHGPERSGSYGWVRKNRNR
jgi:hypothetical protein